MPAGNPAAGVLPTEAEKPHTGVKESRCRALTLDQEKSKGRVARHHGCGSTNKWDAVKKLMLVIVGVLALAASTAKAEDTWLVATVASHHFDSAKPKDYEQRNWGVGIEQGLTENSRILAGFYRNSNRRESFYFGGVWAPLKLGPVRFGITGVLVTGYEGVEVRSETGPDGKERRTVKINDKPLIAAFPVATIEAGRFGVNLAYFPKTSENVAAAGLQLKYRWR